MTEPTQEVLDLVRRWAAAEQNNDADALDEILDGEFTGVGPVGFVLGRKQWMERFRKGLTNRAFAVEDPQIRTFGDAAVVIGVQVQETEVKGNDSSGRFRVSLVAARRDDRWVLANVHIGPLTYPAAQGGS
ncbi:MAG: nuclear transport factor 2 family protein [Spirillospora sp.]